MATVPLETPQCSLLDQVFRMLIGGELTTGESGETFGHLRAECGGGTTHGRCAG